MNKEKSLNASFVLLSIPSPILLPIPDGFQIVSKFLSLLEVIVYLQSGDSVPRSRREFGANTKKLMVV